MKKYLSYFLILFATFISSCETKSGISQLWFYTYSSDPDPDKNTLTPANFLELRSDKTFTSDLGKFQSGHWDFKDQQLFLHADNGEINILLIHSLKSKEMQVQTGKTDAANFEGQSLPEL